MGINSPSLYAAFGCKEALFREAVALYDATDPPTTSRSAGVPCWTRWRAAWRERWPRASSSRIRTPLRSSGFYSAVRDSLSIQTRDGASREELCAVIDYAMIAWDALTEVRAA